MPRRLLIGVFAAVVGGSSPVGCEQAGEAPAPKQAIPDPGDGAIRVEVAQADYARLDRQISATGMTAVWREANLRSEVGGRVLEVAVENGDEVRVGDLLVRIDGSRQQLAISGASAQVDALTQDVELARSDFERKQALVAKGSLASVQLDTAKHALERAEAALAGAKAELGTARRSSSDARLKAPIEGLVTRRAVDVGDTVGAGAPLLDLVDLDKIRVRVGLAGGEIARLDQGAEAKVFIEDLGGEPVPARFAVLAPSADLLTGLFDVEYHVDNPERRIRGGMVATVELPLGRAAERVLVPRAALIRRDGKLAVFVVDASAGPASVAEGPSSTQRGVAQLRVVRVGAYGDDAVEILAGVEPGELVATSAQHALADAVVVEFDAPNRQLASSPGGPRSDQAGLESASLTSWKPAAGGR